MLPIGRAPIREDVAQDPADAVAAPWNGSM